MFLVNDTAISDNVKCKEVLKLGDNQEKKFYKRRYRIIILLHVFCYTINMMPSVYGMIRLTLVEIRLFQAFSTPFCDLNYQ